MRAAPGVDEMQIFSLADTNYFSSTTYTRKIYYPVEKAF